MRTLLTRLPPPLLFVAPLVFALRLDHWRRLPLAPEALRAPIAALGVMLIVLGAALAVSAIALFARGRTTIIPHARARELVTRGPFRLTRNPMYVALTCVYVGVTAVASSSWPLFFLAVPLVVLQALTIPMEERSLMDVFGQDYRAYATRVRRWL